MPKQEYKTEVPLHILFIRGARIGRLNTSQNMGRSYETVIKLTLINYSCISTCFFTPLIHPYSNLIFYKDSRQSIVNVYYTVLLFDDDDDNFIYAWNFWFSTSAETNRGDIKFQDSLCLLKRFQRKGNEILISGNEKAFEGTRGYVLFHLCTSRRLRYFLRHPTNWHLSFYSTVGRSIDFFTVYGLRFPSLSYNLAKTRSRMATTIAFSR